MKRIGLLGGSFDPPHKGHLYISLEAKKMFQLHEVWWLITPQNPLKISRPATYKERVVNCKEITKGKLIIVDHIHLSTSVEKELLILSIKATTQL